jgi:hypothetical protein
MGLRLEEMGCCKSKRALFLLLFWFLYAAILITTYLQRTANAEQQTKRPATPDALMMSVGSTPLSNYLKN